MHTISPPLTVLGPKSLADRVAAGGSPPLRWLLESTTFAESDSKLSIALGEDCAGQPHVVDLTRLPHLLVGGVPWSGKSTFLRAVIATLLCRCSPADLRLVLFSSDPLAFRACEGLPHLLAPPTSDPEAAVAFLEWAQHEMNRRYRILAAAGVRRIEAFNHVPPLLRLLEPPEGAGRPHSARMPYLVAVFDGLDGLAGRWRDGLVESAAELCQMSRAVGMHLVMATEGLSAEALPGQVRMSVPARLCFRQASRLDSAIALGHRGAEELTEAGEALFSGPPAWAPLSLRAPTVSEGGLERVVAMWRDQLAGSTAPGDVA